jgi:NADH-quinone oxidoreductase subunit F
MAVSNVSTQTENDFFGGSLDSRRVYSPCRWNCPVHIDVPGYVTAVAEGRFTDAGIISRATASVGVRPHLPAPVRRRLSAVSADDPLAIAHIKRSAADFGAYL